MAWLTGFADEAKRSDRFLERVDHLKLLAAGLFGEAGSVLAELKKMQREAEAYPHYRHRLTEELGDFLWYFVRVVSETDAALLSDFSVVPSPAKAVSPDTLAQSLRFGASVGEVVRCIEAGESTLLPTVLRTVWGQYVSIAVGANVELEGVARANVEKIRSRWPLERRWHPLFDEDCLPEERLPRALTIEFRERRLGSRIEVILRYRGVNIGDRLTDNIQDPDDYRFHDIFHIAHAVFLGWSPIVRALLRCKRKSMPEVDENQDGARAAILEEAISAVVFSRAKRMRYFEDAGQIDYDLLKSIQEFVAGYEVERIALWQWERAILEGFRVFRQLRSGGGGVVSWDIGARRLDWSPIGSSRAQG